MMLNKVVRFVTTFNKGLLLLSAAVVFIFLLAACGGASASTAIPATTTSLQASPSPSSQAGSTSGEQPVAPENNPAGDIPDTQVFVKYSSPSGGYQLEVPEGWARTENGPNVNFADKLDGVKVTIVDAPAAPTASEVNSNFAGITGEKSARAVQIGRVQTVQLAGGQAVFAEYTSNSEPNSVTGKQVRLENNAYLFYRSGKLAVLIMWSPLGADNVDQWQRMSGSFQWQ